MNKVMFAIQVCPKSTVPPFNYHFPIQVKCPACECHNFRVPDQDVDKEVLFCTRCSRPHYVRDLVTTAMKLINY